MSIVMKCWPHHYQKAALEAGFAKLDPHYPGRLIFESEAMVDALERFALVILRGEEKITKTLATVDDE